MAASPSFSSFTPSFPGGVTPSLDDDSAQALNATEFFARYADEDPMRATECSRAVIRFQPSNEQFMNILGPAGYVMVVGATLALAVLVALYTHTIHRIQKTVPSEHKFSVCVILSVYPVLGLCSYLAILFPKANALMDAASQLWFAVCMLQFFKLTLMYFGGETAFVKTVEGKVLPWRGPPCCCWPCFWPLYPKTPVNKLQVRLIRILVIQHPFVQSIMSIIGLSLWVEGYYTAGHFSFTDAYAYIFAITTISFMFGLWAFIVLFKASIPELRKFHYGRKILTFQFVVICLRLQAFIFGMILIPSGAIPCVPPLSPAVYANTILCCLLMGQLVILSVLARHFYTMPMAKVPSDVKDITLLEEGGSGDEEMEDFDDTIVINNNPDNVVEQKQ